MYHVAAGYDQCAFGTQRGQVLAQVIHGNGTGADIGADHDHRDVRPGEHVGQHGPYPVVDTPVVIYHGPGFQGQDALGISRRPGRFVVDAVQGFRKIVHIVNLGIDSAVPDQDALSGPVGGYGNNYPGFGQSLPHFLPAGSGSIGTDGVHR